MGLNRAQPPRPVARSDRREMPLWQEVEDDRMDWVEDKRLYLPSTGQVGDSLYSSTGETVRTLKRPIRGRGKTVHHDGYVLHQSWRGNDKYETGRELDQTGVIPDSYTDQKADPCLVAQLTWAPAQTLPQGR